MEALSLAIALECAYRVYPMSKYLTRAEWMEYLAHDAAVDCFAAFNK